MKPYLSFFACLFLFFSGIISCTKTVTQTNTVTVTDTVVVNTPPTYSIQGLWIGTYTATSAPNQPPYFYSFDIQPGGLLVVQAQGPSDTAFAKGTWTLSGDTLQCNYIYISPSVAQSATAIFNNTGTLSSGLWQDMSNSGTFSMTRIE